MGDDRFARNTLFITPEQQKKIKETRIIFGGVGLGSVIAETALRLGFENFFFVDMDDVELSNLNRQNYETNDVGIPKVEGIKRRLQAINPHANIHIQKTFLKEENIRDYVTSDFDIAINALDYDNNAPFIFDNICIEHGIPSIHPGNFSWAATAFVVLNSRGENINSFNKTQGPQSFFDLLDFMIAKIAQDHEVSTQWIQDRIDILKKDQSIPIPQTVIGASIVAGLTVSIMFGLLFEESKIKAFPHIYYLDTPLVTI